MVAKPLGQCHMCGQHGANTSERTLNIKFIESLADNVGMRPLLLFALHTAGPRTQQLPRDVLGGDAAKALHRTGAPGSTTLLKPQPGCASRVLYIGPVLETPANTSTACGLVPHVARGGQARRVPPGIACARTQCVSIYVYIYVCMCLKYVNLLCISGVHVSCRCVMYLAGLREL